MMYSYRLYQCDMEHRLLRHFLAVVEHGNMLRAASAIHISQPALTKSIQNLEAELGVPLFERRPRGVVPTVYGKALFEHATLLQNHAEQAVAAIRAIKDGTSGHLRVGVASFAMELLPSVIAQLIESEPGVTYEVVAGTYEDLTALVREGALDAAVVGFPLTGRPEDLVHERLTVGEFVFACGAKHPLAKKKRASLAELVGEDWAITNRPRAIVERWELEFRLAKLTPPPLRVQSGSMIFVKSLVAKSKLLTFLHRDFAAADFEAGRLVALSVPLKQSMSTVEGIIYRADAVRPPALSRFVEAIRAASR